MFEEDDDLNGLSSDSNSVQMHSSYQQDLFDKESEKKQEDHIPSRGGKRKESSNSPRLREALDKHSAKIERYAQMLNIKTAP